MSDIATNLFVYGTLMPGESNYWQIEDLVIDHKPGTIDGVLVDLGSFPALIPGKGRVRGIILRLDREALEITDRIEGCASDRHCSLYVREESTVLAKEDQEIVAWTYVYANLDSVAGHPRCVVGELNGLPLHAWPPANTLYKNQRKRGTS